MLIIGDVHGKIGEYHKIVKGLDNHELSIQVGDFGFSPHHDWHLQTINSEFHKINFGNHDDYTYLDKPHSLRNYSVLHNEIMTVRGAYSVDLYRRIKNVDWWENEELNYIEWQQAVETYNEVRPKIMITHDCPDSIRKYFFNIYQKSITSNGLQAMLEFHQPDIWVFGHHHRSKTESINGTKFICLAELETLHI